MSIRILGTLYIETRLVDSTDFIAEVGRVTQAAILRHRKRGTHCQTANAATSYCSWPMPRNQRHAPVVQN